MGKKYKKDTFFDANGQLRMAGDQYYDSKGMLRGPEDQFYDSKGILRMPGEEYYDAKGILRQPGDQFYDESGQLRTPIEEKEENFTLNNPINSIHMPNDSQNKYPSGSSGISDKPLTFGKILTRICITLIFIGAAFTKVWEEVVVPIYNGNYLTWVILPFVVGTIVSSIICIFLYKKYLHIFGYFIRTISSIVPLLIYFLILTKFSSNSDSLAAVFIFSVAISLVVSYVSLFITKLYRKKYNRG